MLNLRSSGFSGTAELWNLIGLSLFIAGQLDGTIKPVLLYQLTVCRIAIRSVGFGTLDARSRNLTVFAASDSASDIQASQR